MNSIITLFKDKNNHTVKYVINMYSFNSPDINEPEDSSETELNDKMPAKAVEDAFFETAARYS